MPKETSERARVGSRLSCSVCGTQVQMRQVGAGRMECCDQPLQGIQSSTAASDSSRRVRCSGCGNEALIERDGGGSLECCNEGMEPVARA